jgi:hypothetical protein
MLDMKKKNRTLLILECMAVIFLIICSIAIYDCSETSDKPIPPFQLPFAIHQAGAIVSTKLWVKDSHTYPLFLDFMFNENDRVDKERVRKLVGSGGYNKFTGKLVDPGIQIPLKITVNLIDSSGERLFLEKEVLTEGVISWGGNVFSRKVGYIELVPGLYRVTVQSLKGVPELMDTKVILGISLRERGKS